MNELTACADLCEQHGFTAPAAALRALADGPPPFYLVRALMSPEYAHYDGLDAEDVAPPDRKIFLDRDSAERFARSLTTRAIRHIKTVSGTTNPSNLTNPQFCTAVSAILNVTYSLPKGEGSRLFPDEATDEQMWQLSQLLPLQIFDVAGFADSSDPEL